MNIVKAGVPESGNDATLAAFDAVYSVQAALVSGAISPTQGLVALTKAGIAVMTLATPVAGLPSAGGNDGQELVIIDTTGNAHTVTTAASKINGSLHIITFAGSIGDLVMLRAYGGVWYTNPSNSGVVIS
jgi:hypothetical protein